MVFRNPTPAGSFIPVSSSSRPAHDPASLTPPSLEIVTPDPSPSPPSHLRRSRNHRVEVPQSFNAISGNPGSLSVRKDDAAEKPLPVKLHEDETSRSVEGSQIEPPDILRTGLSGSEKATPRSSMDSGRSRGFREEDFPGSRHANNDTRQLRQPLRLEMPAMSMSEPDAAPLPPIIRASDPPKSAKPSNNPFRRENPHKQSTTSTGYTSDDFNSDQDAHKAHPPETPIEMTANLSLADRPFSEYSTSFRPSTLNLNSAFQKQEPEQTPLPPVQKPPEPSPSQPPTSFFENSIDSRQPPLPVSMEDPVETAIGSLHIGLLNGPNGPAQDSIPIRESARPASRADLEKALPAMPPVDSFSLDDIPTSAGQSLAIPCQYAISSQGTSVQKPYFQENPPPTPPRPEQSFRTTAEAEMSKLREQRNETYQIKHFNWFDHSSRTLRRSSMLTQNKNGPCPLLALVNALILSEENGSRSALGSALRTREQVSLGLIIESLMDELTSEGRDEHLTELPDVDELNRFLLLLHTGMTANPRLASPGAPSPNLMDARNSSLHLPLSLNNDRQPGTFEETQNMHLYGAFGIPLVHGWLAPRSDPARAAFLRSAQTYEDAQTILFREEELDDKLSRVGLAPDEQQLLQDISSIKSFLESYPTQITPYGLDIINESLFPAACAILFRNDHFSTIYKHPESGQLFTLVTDAGYSDRDEVIWESLVDVSGQNGEFFSGDFRPIGNADATGKPQESRSDGSLTNRAAQSSTQLYGLPSPASPQEQQQQADADFAMALQLQEEEEARMDDSRRHSDVNDPMPSRNPDMSNSNWVRNQAATRPSIPSRNARNQGVTRPVDLNSDEAPPPAYEEAAKGRPYLPPTGHPQHPSFDDRSPTSGPSTSMHPRGPGFGQAAPRRVSASQERSQFQHNPPLTRPHTNNHFGVAQSSGRPREREKDCIIM